MKHDPTTALRSFLWPNILERLALASMIPFFPSCIGIINDTLIKICGPWKNSEYRKWFNGRKKMYCMNNIVIVDDHGFFIYVDPSYPGIR